MIIEPRPESLILSKGCVLDTFWPGDYSAASATQIRFYDNTGTPETFTIDGLADWRGLWFLHTDTTALDTIPHGRVFEVFVTVAGNPHKQFYGRVMRREATSSGDIVKAIT